MSEPDHGDIVAEVKALSTRVERLTYVIGALILGGGAEAVRALLGGG